MWPPANLHSTLCILQSDITVFLMISCMPSLSDLGYINKVNFKNKLVMYMGATETFCCLHGAFIVLVYLKNLVDCIAQKI